MKENLTETFDKAKEAEQEKEQEQSRCLGCYCFICVCSSNKMTSLKSQIDDQPFDMGSGI